MRGILKLALLSTAFAGLSGAASAETLKLGVLATLSGAGTAWGIAMQGAAELAAEDVNANGGLEVAGKKYKVEIVAYDDHYKAADALTAFNRMAFDDGIKYVVGPLGSAPALAMLPVSTENKVITMTMAFTPKALSPRNSRGSQKSESTRRKIAATRSSPVKVLRNTCPLRTTRSSPSTRVKPR